MREGLGNLFVDLRVQFEISGGGGRDVFGHEHMAVIKDLHPDLVTYVHGSLALGVFFRMMGVYRLRNRCFSLR